MRPDLLEEAVAADRAAGLRPFCVVATVGTTSTTSIDPVAAIAEIAAREGIWLHVDAAYAGSAGIVPEYRWILDGCGRADSLVFNPHKWLMVPVDCSVLYCARPEVLRQTFSLVPEILRTSDGGLNFMDYGVPLGHRFRALKLWFVLRYYGHVGLAEIIRDQIAMTQELRELMAGDARFEICAPAPLSVICFRRRGKRRRESDAARCHQRIGTILPFGDGGARALYASYCNWQYVHQPRNARRALESS